MEGSIRKRGNKWYYSFEAGMVDGKRKRIERVGGRTKKEAETALRLALSEYENAGLHFEPCDISVSDYLDYWFQNYVTVNCKYNTQEGYKLIIKNHIKPVLGIYKLKSLTPAILQQFINEKYLTGLSKNHLSNIMSVVSSALNYAVYPYEFIKSNPMQYVKYPKYEHTRAETNRRVISIEEIEKITERFPQGSSFYIPIVIGYHTGCRIGEVLALTWADIDLENSTIDINKNLYKRKPDFCFGSTKTKSSVRTIKIGKTLLDILKKHQIWQKENRLKYGEHYIAQYEKVETVKNETIRRVYSLPLGAGSALPALDMVCTKECGDLVTHDTFRYASRVINYSLGIPFHFHSLRHTHATMLLENHANVKDVQVRLGHADIETTLGTYTHATEKMSDQTVDIFEKVCLPTS